MVEFIRRDPATAAFTAGLQQGDRRRANEAAIESSDQRRVQAESALVNAGNLDRRLRDYYAQPQQEPATSVQGAPAPQPEPAPASSGSPLRTAGQNIPAAAAPSPEAARVSRQQGAIDVMKRSPGYAVQGVQQQGQIDAQQTQREAAQTKQFIDLIQTDPQTAVAYARQQGINLPPQFQEAVQNSWFRQQLKMYSDQFAKQYASDPVGYSKAMETALRQIHGQLTAAGQQAAAGQGSGIPQGVPGPVQGLPMPTPNALKLPSYTYYPGKDGTGVVGLDAHGGAPIQHDDISIQRFSGAGANRTSVYQQKYGAWLAAHPEDTQGALAYASGQRQIAPQEEEKWAHAMAVREAREDYSKGSDPNFLTNRVKEILAGWRGQGGMAQSAPGAAVPGSTPMPAPGPAQAPAPAQPPAQAAPAPQAAPTGGAGRWEVIEGQVVRQVGTYQGKPVYQDQDGNKFLAQ